MNSDEFEERLQALRPRLHRYCARMVGSTVDGEDVLQDVLVNALRARMHGEAVGNLEGWLFRIAHNASLDFLRHRSRHNVVRLIEAPGIDPLPQAEVVTIAFHSFLHLSELQRCAVILKDVLGHSVYDIARVADCTPIAAKSALQRGRAALRKLADTPEETRLPLLSEADRQKMSAYVEMFRAGDFDAIRAMLAEDVKLELVNRLKLKGKGNVDVYFTRYAEEPKWRFAFGAVDGQPAMLVFDRAAATPNPAHFVLIEWRAERIAEIRDFLFATYALEAVDWASLG